MRGAGQALSSSPQTLPLPLVLYPQPTTRKHMRRRMINIVGPERFSSAPSREAGSPRRGNTTRAGRVWASLAAGMLLLALTASACGEEQSAPPAAAPPAAEPPAATSAATPE